MLLLLCALDRLPIDLYALEANEELIRKENESDVCIAKEERIVEVLVSRLTLKPKNISGLAKSVRILVDMIDTIGEVMKRTEVADGLILEKTTCSLGVFLIVFESRPDVLVQITSLAVQSGNGLLL
jgi:delta-1-pyrroline-5-carboxylate synthetase